MNKTDTALYALEEIITKQDFEIKRYRQALERIAKPEQDLLPVSIKAISVAKKALAGGAE